MTARTRLHSVDGLRGLAALVVVVHHVLLLDTWFSAAQFASAGVSGGGPARRLLYYSPLHIVCAGTEAVAVFFVLSGIVLAAAFPLWSSLRPSYLISRLSRLYLPIAAALILALCWTSVRPSVPTSALSRWHAYHLRAPTWADVLARPRVLARDLFVLNGTSWLDSSLWSMRVEIAASIGLTVIIAAARMGWVAFAAAVALTAATRHVDEIAWFTRYLPMFIGGACLVMGSWRPSRRQADALWVAGMAAFTTPWIAAGIGAQWRDGLPGTLWLLAGGMTMGAAALGDSFLSRVLAGRVGQYLASRSYSLYLVHAPIVTTMGFIAVSQGRPQWAVWMPLAALVSLAVADVFYRCCEAPAHRLSRSMRKRIAAREERWAIALRSRVLGP